MSVTLASMNATGLGRAAYRLMAFAWWLRRADTRAQGYAYVGALDTDLIFQADIFDVLAETAAARAGERRKRKESGGVEKGAAGTGATSLRPEERPRFEPLDPASLPTPGDG